MGSVVKSIGEPNLEDRPWSLFPFYIFIEE